MLKSVYLFVGYCSARASDREAAKSGTDMGKVTILLESLLFL